MKKKYHVILFFSSLFLGLGTYFLFFSKQPVKTTLIYQQPKKLHDFTLVDQHGVIFNKQRLAGHWTLFFVGYTSCPDICPTTLIEIQKVAQELHELDIQFVMVSVDPEHDSLSKLKQYMSYFDSHLLAVRAEHPQLYPFTKQLGLMYSKFDSQEDYAIIDHSASMVLVNPHQQIVAMLKPQLHDLSAAMTLSAKEILFDLKLLLSGRASS